MLYWLLMFTFEKDDGVFDYIARMEFDYEEPQREGTPRGEKIGFTTKKYLASLLVGLTNFKLKKLADDLNRKYGLSYGLLKKWRTEAYFKGACEGHASDFADFLFDKFVVPEAGGEWFERLDRQGNPVDDAIAHAWKINYHSVRSAIQVIERLKRIRD